MDELVLFAKLINLLLREYLVDGSIQEAQLADKRNYVRLLCKKLSCPLEVNVLLAASKTIEPEAKIGKTSLQILLKRSLIDRV